ncbi:MAG: MerR family transcriptional regulator [Nitrospirae bacterium]|nr:MAG: MerR family transcriptional regulator [Nitrospirota bacterium]
MGSFRIHRVAKLTGLSVHTIRAWERRYGLVNPARSTNRYRVYTDEDILVLRYLKEQTDQGVPISELAQRGRESLLAEARRSRWLSPPPERSGDRLLADLQQALVDWDRRTFEEKLNGAIAVVPMDEACERILFPLQRAVGDLWHAGRIGVAQEHFATQLVKQKIAAAMNQLRAATRGPEIVVACPEGEYHDIAAQAVAYTCLSLGFPVSFLGANVPTTELLFFCRKALPSVVLLSITMTPTSESLLALVRTLVGELGHHTTLGLGGQAIESTATWVAREPVRLFPTIRALEIFLDTLRP